MRFQIWRPSNGTNELEYDLVAEKEARPTVQQQREDVSSLVIYIENDK